MNLNKVSRTCLIAFFSSVMLQACSTADDLENLLSDLSEEVKEIEEIEEVTINPTTQDLRLTAIIDNFRLDQAVEIAHLPNISEALPQLGMQLFYSKSLSGDMDTACVTCHHPSLGGADGLSLPVGVAAVEPALLGLGRENANAIPLVPRNAPTIFNIGLWDTGLFWDSRVESIGKEAATNGSVSGIRTPDTAYLVADTNTGANLTSAQAGFPVASVEEMKGNTFESGSDNTVIRDHLAARIGGYGNAADELATNEWLVEFQQAFGSNADSGSLITFENIAEAIGEYERSMVFISSPWRDYLDGDLSAMDDQEKAGAELFFSGVDEGGAGCGSCHNGPLLSDGQHHVVAFPHAGPGKGDTNDDDFGRERETGDAADRYSFRTPSLLNIGATGPYGHTGVYQSLEDVVRHYVNPNRAVSDFFNRGGICNTPQYRNVENCQSLYPNNADNSQLALNKLQQERNDGVSRFESPRLNNMEIDQVVAFMRALSDPCVDDRACLSEWIPDTNSQGVDGQQLNAINNQGALL
jgi:cytochrome c peroxidase